MAKFEIVLTPRNKRKDGLLDLCIRYINKGDVMYLPIIKMDPQTYKQIFTDKRTDEKCIKWREQCAGYITRCERIYNRMNSFNKKEFREIFYERNKGKNLDENEHSLKLSDMFTEYVKVTILKNKTKDHYHTTSNVLNTFKKDLTINDINKDFLTNFSNHKKNIENCSQATVDSHMRNLRSVINYYRNVKKGLPNDFDYPFGKGKFIISSFFPSKSVLTNKEIQSIVDFNDFKTDEQKYARDIWLTLYRMNGINFADLLRMKWTDIQGNILSITRKKTETTRKSNIKPIVIPYTEKVKEVLNRIGNKKTPYILGKLEDGYSEITFDNICGKFKQKINRQLVFLTEELNLSVPLKLGKARDCYATTLDRADVSMQKISNMLGHSNVLVTEHYIGSLSAEKTFDINDCIM